MKIKYLAVVSVLVAPLSANAIDGVGPNIPVDPVTAAAAAAGTVAALVESECRSDKSKSCTEAGKKAVQDTFDYLRLKKNPLKSAKRRLKKLF